MGIPPRLLLRPLLAGVLLGLFVSVMLIPIYGFPEGLLLSLGVGLTFGLALLIANALHVRAVQSRGGSKNLLKSYHMRELELPVPYDRAFDLCMDAVRSLDKCEIRKSDRRLGRIVAVKPTKVPLDWIYNRDLITVELHKIDDGRTSVKVSSRIFPDPPSGHYVDYGSNLENVGKISEFLLGNCAEG